MVLERSGEVAQQEYDVIAQREANMCTVVVSVTLLFEL